MKWSACFPVLLSAALNLFPATDANSADISIGVSAPYTGPFALYGSEISPGVEQAIDDLNSRGGVLGNRLSLVRYDDQCAPQKAVQAVERMVIEDKVALLIGPFCTNAALSVDQLLQTVQPETVQILSAATASVLTERGRKNLFRVVPRADRQGPLLADYLRRLNDYSIALTTRTPPTPPRYKARYCKLGRISKRR
jgi:branched-chain amino acid transport system substrate-binding protein